MGISDQYAELWKAIIRPPRDRYELKDLGPKRFRIAGQVIHRTDLVLENPYGKHLQCSWFQPERRPAKELPCVVYLHGNCSSRIEGLSALPVLLPFGITVFTFDFAGSGRSDGEYVSLGYFEKDDLACVVEHLRATGTVSTIGLWGRSMGAATALLHGDRDPSIAGMVLDSPFQDLRIVAEELVIEFGGFRVPKFVVNIAMSMIRNSIKSRADFDINDLVPIKHVDRTFIPALFVAAEGDTFVKPHHARALYDAYAGDKNLSAGITRKTIQVPYRWPHRFATILTRPQVRCLSGGRWELRIAEVNLWG
ncbi:Protein C14orf29, putative [Perkinsus marinus ATCC 50983]|uniref:Protein C14orf29, putative n=1 Tax=Perkinsus marinus (strain ATCC 50983 / TXsc) TaxID=423536 RepID=C5K977_PERM5|nr:Protein C14orf29, putative [Perkinsus marinus ATCC 50983]EER18983.1 Protein C14orf29, putative [Perkinsus marinus ATCC 50983]|eukprot:XP_002787187.1 Protein C14orf29, putative [Perkinsus marinus ATCC 50983]